MTLREQAAWLCDVCASAKTPPTFAEYLLAHVVVDAEAAAIADAQMDALMLDEKLDSVYDMRELWAEAAQRLRGAK